MSRFKKRLIYVILLTILSLSIYTISYTSSGQPPTYSIDYPPTDIALLIPDYKPIPIQAILDSNLYDDESFELVQDKLMIIVVKAPGADSVELSFQGPHTLSKTAPDANGNYLFYSDPFRPITTTTSESITGFYMVGITSNPLTEVQVNVKETYDLSLYYSHLEHLDNKGEPKTKKDYGTVEASRYNDMYLISTSFIEDTYPVSNVIADAPIRAIEGQTKKGYQHMLTDAQAAKENAVLNDYGSAVGVGVCPDDPNAEHDYFEYHKKPDYAGISFGPDVKGVLVLEGYYTMVAHEVAHTFGLYYPGLEQYQLTPPDGEEAVGLRVEDGTWRSGFCFMGTAPHLTLLDSWVSNFTWEELFTRLKDPLSDPEILLACGVVYKNGTVGYPRDWYRIDQGTPDILYPGNYSLVFLDENGDNISETSFDAQFFVYVEPKMCATRYESKFGRMETDFAGFAFTTVYPPGTEMVEVWNNTDPARVRRMSVVDAGTIKTVRADAGGPYFGSEGSVIVFNASGSIGTYDRDLYYMWDFEGDGVWDTPWSTEPTAEHTWYDDWEGYAVVNVTDKMTFDTDTSIVNITNEDPIVEITLERKGLLGEDINFIGSIIDPGKDDSHTVVWDLGDRTTVSDILEPTHTYEKTEFYTVTLTVTDDDGGIGTNSIMINVYGKNSIWRILIPLIVALCAIIVAVWPYYRKR